MNTQLSGFLFDIEAISFSDILKLFGSRFREARVFTDLAFNLVFEVSKSRISLEQV